MTERTQLTLGDCGNFAAITTQPATIKALLTGTLIGICSGVSNRKSPDKMTVYRGMMGEFLFVPAAPADAMIESRNLFFPPDFNNLLEPLLKQLETGGDGAEIRFAYEMSAVRSANAAGFSVNFDPKIPPVIIKRMESFMAATGTLKEVSGNRVLVVSDTASAPAPEAKPKK